MADLEKAAPTFPIIPPPSYHAGSTPANFGPLYDHFVNDNMRAFPGPSQLPPQAYDHIDRPERNTRFPSKRRQALYFAIGLVLILALCLTGYFALGKANEHDDDKGKEPARPAILPTTSSTSTVTVSISVSISTTTTNNTVTSQHATIVATTAPIPSSIAIAASSFYAAVSANAESALASEASIMSAATSLYPTSTSTTLTTAALSPALTVVTTLPPTTTTTTTATHITEGDDDEAIPTTMSYRHWINFCGVPGQGCG